MQSRNFGNQEPGDWPETELSSRIQQANKSTVANQGRNNRVGNDHQGETHQRSGTSSVEERVNVDGVLRSPTKAPADDLPLIPVERSGPQCGQGQAVVDPRVVMNTAPLGNVPNRAYRKRKRFRTAPIPPDKTLLTEDEAAYMLDLKPESLAVFRSTGRHQIPYIKIGRNVRYRRSDLEAWLISHTHSAGTTRKEES